MSVAVSYGVRRLGTHGGAIKFSELARFFPNEIRGYSVLYLGSSTTPPKVDRLIARARRSSSSSASRSTAAATSSSPANGIPASPTSSAFPPLAT